MPIKSGINLGFQQRAQEWKARQIVQGQPPTSVSGNTGKSETKTAYYDSAKGGVVTSDGKFYPSSNPAWVPNGYAYSQPQKTTIKESVAPTSTYRSVEESAAEISRIAKSDGRDLSEREKNISSRILQGRLKTTTPKMGLYNQLGGQ